MFLGDYAGVEVAGLGFWEVVPLFAQQQQADQRGVLAW